MSIVTRLGTCVLVVGLAACLAITSARVGTSPSTASPRTADLAGHTFAITGISYDGTAEPIVPGSRPALVFHQSSIQVVTGCNRMSADYVVLGDRLTLTNGMSTAMGCPPAVGTQESRLGQVLDGTSVLTSTADGYTVTSGPLTLALTPT